MSLPGVSPGRASRATLTAAGAGARSRAQVIERPRSTERNDPSMGWLVARWQRAANLSFLARSERGLDQDLCGGIVAALQGNPPV